MQFHGFQYLQSYAAITPILEHFNTPKVKSSYQKSPCLPIPDNHEPTLCACEFACS